MIKPTHFVEVEIAGRTLKLAPLKRELAGRAGRTAIRLVAAVGQPMSDEWIKDNSDALGFVFLAAKKAHPDLTLNDLHDSATAEEIKKALDALGVLTFDFFLAKRQSGRAVEGN
ncbi:MAG TPA: hypothetical protein VOA64_02420 [Candidatus Dormibacteraeota bacterium]|nr:hypothetical protein [Candidatus Dormibacteraeota bacterium]